jgi:hypothetical protein
MYYLNDMLISNRVRDILLKRNIENIIHLPTWASHSFALLHHKIENKNTGINQLR